MTRRHVVASTSSTRPPSSSKSRRDGPAPNCFGSPPGRGPGGGRSVERRRHLNPPGVDNGDSSTQRGGARWRRVAHRHARRHTYLQWEAVGEFPVAGPPTARGPRWPPARFRCSRRAGTHWRRGWKARQGGPRSPGRRSRPGHGAETDSMALENRSAPRPRPGGAAATQGPVDVLAVEHHEPRQPGRTGRWAR